MMSANRYRVSVWTKALADAEIEVLRHTATPVGGRLSGEGLMTYVERATTIQEDAIQRWVIARVELDTAIEKSCDT